jgi:hypothetical protein
LTVTDAAAQLGGSPCQLVAHDQWSCSHQCRHDHQAGPMARWEYRIMVAGSTAIRSVTCRAGQSNQGQPR